MVRIPLIPALAIGFATSSASPRDVEWPQFRGPGGLGVSSTARPPLGFSPTSNCVWSIAIPPGHSSPVISGDRIFLTGMNQGHLETWAVNRADGRVLWQRTLPTSPTPWKRPPDDDAAALRAVPTPVTDGRSVFVFHGRYGVAAYDRDGSERWHTPIPNVEEEATASPILVGDRLIIVSDQSRGSFIQALHRHTGGVLWRTDRPGFPQGRSTPFHWVTGTQEELVLPGSLWLTSYNPLNGSENWRMAGLALVSAGSPTAFSNLLFTSSVPPGEVDVNLRRTDEGSETPGLVFGLDPVLPRPQPHPDSGILAVSAGGRGDITGTHLAWKVSHGPPAYSSPICLRGRLFTVKTGGFVSAYDAATGRPVFQDARLDAPGYYYASPVAASDRVYFTSGHGVVTVLDATSDTPRILGRGSVGAETTATPALVDQMILFRTLTHLTAFQSRTD